MTRDEFIKRWRTHLAGLAIFGFASDSKDGPMVRATKILDIPADVERLAGKMFDDAQPDKPHEPKPANNGQAAIQQPVRK